MAGDLFLKERSIITLQDRTNVTAMTDKSGAAAATADLDMRSAGNAPEDMLGYFELLCRWATITNILNGLGVADLFLVPLLDGSNLPDVDLTAGASNCPMSTYVGTFPCCKQAVANTDMRFVLGPVILFPALLRAHLINRSTQTMTTTSGSSWQLKVVTARGQYT